MPVLFIIGVALLLALIKHWPTPRDIRRNNQPKPRYRGYLDRE